MTFVGQRNRNRSPFGGIASLIIVIVAFLAFFWLASKFLALLSAIAPIMLVIAAILNYKVIIDYGRFVLNKLKHNTIFGIILVLFTIIGFPLVSAYLLFKAWNNRLIGRSEEPNRNESVFEEYEEIDEDFLDLPDLDAPPQEKSSGTNYDQYFE